MDKRDDAIRRRIYARPDGTGHGGELPDSIRTVLSANSPCSINQDLIDFSKPVIVVPNGHTTDFGIVTPSVETLLKQARIRHNPGRSYSAAQLSRSQFPHQHHDPWLLSRRRHTDNCAAAGLWLATAGRPWRRRPRAGCRRFTPGVTFYLPDLDPSHACLLLPIVENYSTANKIGPRRFHNFCTTTCWTIRSWRRLVNRLDLGLHKAARVDGDRCEWRRGGTEGASASSPGIPSPVSITSKDGMMARFSLPSRKALVPY
ncbi:MAG: hypothetical protein U0361_02050 [Nitrospiraceae bacterium]